MELPEDGTCLSSVFSFRPLPKTLWLFVIQVLVQGIYLVGDLCFFDAHPS